MSFPHRILLFTLLWVGVLQVSAAAMPAPDALGQLLGFPSSELVVEDVTAEERIILQTPSIKEKRRNAILPDPAVLLKAYLIRGKNENTFVPIQIYIGNRDAFLTPELLEKVDKYTAGLRSKNPSWKVDFESLGRGGMYFTQDHKVKSEGSGFKEPRGVVADVILLQPKGESFDIKIVMRWSLPMGAKLIPISGGETYYSIYGTLEDENREPKLDLAKATFELSKTVITEWQNEHNAASVVPPKDAVPSQQATPTKALDAAPQSGPSASSPATRSIWWVAGFALVAVAFFANTLRKRRR
jgi:hypothetical protein